MATVYFIEGATNLSTAANWNTAIDGSGSTGAPAAGDTAIIAFDNTITAGHTALDLGTNGLASLLITGDIRTSGAAAGLTVDCHLTGASAIRCENNTPLTLTGGSTNGVENLIIDAPGANITLAGGTFDDVFLLRGRLTINASAVVTALTQTGGECFAYDGATGFTSIRALGGRLSFERDATAVTADGNAAVFAMKQAAVTTLNLHSATYNHRAGTTITTVNQYAGLFTPYQASNNFTVTTANRYGGQFATRSNSITVTIGTDGVVESPTTLSLSTLSFSAPLPQ